MEEQASHLHHLLEERFDIQAAYRPDINFPVYTPGGCNPGYTAYPQNLGNQEIYPAYSYDPRYTNRNTNQFYSNAQRTQPLTNAEKNQLMEGLNPQFISQLTSHNPELVENLNDEVMALQMTNLKLNISIKKEESRRKCAENELVKEREYIKKLENNIQNLKSSRIVMDPKTYKQVAENYIATRKRPVRRSHTCHPCIGEGDLVCDNNVQVQPQVLTPVVTSCPSSPLNVKTSANKEQHGESKSHHWAEDEQTTMQREEYQNLLSSLADIEMPSSSPPMKSVQ